MYTRLLRRNLLIVGGPLMAMALIGPRAALAQAEESKPVEPDRSMTPRVRMETSLGAFVLELDAEKTPITVLNFLEYAEAGFYSGTLFHRVLKDGLIQGGVYTLSLEPKTEGLRPPIDNETAGGLRNERGTIAMFRELRQPRSATAQFYINVIDNPGFDALRDGSGYTAFGKVVEGMDVVDRIAATPVRTHPKYAAGYSEVVPVDPVLIKSVQLTTPFDHQKTQELVDAAKIDAKRREELAKMTAEQRVAMVAAQLEQETSGKFTTLPSGVRVLTVREGTGAKPGPEETIEFNYRATLTDGEEIGSTFQDDPVKRPVSGLLPGVREVVLTMKEGGRAKLIVPPDLAYGAGGVPGRIPAEAWLVFDMELLSID